MNSNHEPFLGSDGHFVSKDSAPSLGAGETLDAGLPRFEADFFAQKSLRHNHQNPAVSRSNGLCSQETFQSLKQTGKLRKPLLPSTMASLSRHSYLPLYVDSLVGSSLSKASPEVFRASVFLWMAAFRSQQPGTLPNDLNAWLSMGKIDRTTFAAHGREIVSQWVLCDDGRFYHPYLCRVIATTHNVMVQSNIAKERDRIRKAQSGAGQSGAGAGSAALDSVKMLVPVDLDGEICTFELRSAKLIPKKNRVVRSELYSFIVSLNQTFERLTELGLNGPETQNKQSPQFEREQTTTADLPDPNTRSGRDAGKPAVHLVDGCEQNSNALRPKSKKAKKTKNPERTRPLFMNAVNEEVDQLGRPSVFDQINRDSLDIPGNDSGLLSNSAESETIPRNLWKENQMESNKKELKPIEPKKNDSNWAEPNQAKASKQSTTIDQMANGLLSSGVGPALEHETPGSFQAFAGSAKNHSPTFASTTALQSAIAPDRLATADERKKAMSMHMTADHEDFCVDSDSKIRANQPLPLSGSFDFRGFFSAPQTPMGYFCDLSQIEESTITGLLSALGFCSSQIQHPKTRQFTGRLVALAQGLCPLVFEKAWVASLEKMREDHQASLQTQVQSREIGKKPAPWIPSPNLFLGTCAKEAERFVLWSHRMKHISLPSSVVLRLLKMPFFHVDTCLNLIEIDARAAQSLLSLYDCDDDLIRAIRCELKSQAAYRQSTKPLASKQRGVA